MKALALRHILLALLLAPIQPLAAQEGVVVVYVVRHAERADDGAPASQTMTDPPLSEDGVTRSRDLAALLLPVGLTHVHSTDYLRTRSTARPTAEATGIELALYDPDDQGAFARRLIGTPGTHLIVGHSNTVPQLVAALGGDPREPIEPLEYDRVYVIYILPGGAAGSAMFRYGAPYGRP